VFVLDPLEAEQELRPTQTSPTGAMWVVPATDGDTAWIVQPGLEGDPTMLELRNIENGERLITAEADPGLAPVGATVDGLVFNTVGNQVVLFTNSGATLPLGNGRAIATNDTSVVALTCSGDLPAGCEELWFGRTDETDIFYITQPDQGAWTPFETTLPVISPDGTKLLIGFGLPTTTVHMVDLVDGGVQPIAPYVPGMHPAWSADGNWIALISDSDIDLINASDPTQVVPLRNVIPTGFVPIAAG
jgi:WD40-like Beta Propeller Repeat